MKKIFIITVFLLALINPANAYEGIYDGNQIIYNPTTKIFSTGGMAPSRIVMTKKTSSGSGGYSEYYLPNGRMEFMTGGNFEFIQDGKLISVHNSDLQFYKIIYENGSYTEKQIGTDSLKKIFPDAEIVKLSQFKNNELIITKDFLKKKQIILWNDTDKHFYKYSFNKKNISDKYITGLILLKMPETIIFSHYKENSSDNPSYKIIVKNKYPKIK